MRSLASILGFVAILAGCAHRSPALVALEPLCGAWLSDDGHVVQERWRLTRDGLAGDSHTGDPNGRVVGLESMTLTAGPRGTVYHAEPGGAAPTDFTEVADPSVVAGPGEKVWIWANPAHDFPRRIVYRLAGDRLIATISDPDGDDEARRGRTFRFKRITACE
jgi:hypothetical protein